MKKKESTLAKSNMFILAMADCCQVSLIHAVLVWHCSKNPSFLVLRHEVSLLSSMPLKSLPSSVAEGLEKRTTPFQIPFLIFMLPNHPNQNARCHADHCREGRYQKSMSLESSDMTS